MEGDRTEKGGQGKNKGKTKQTGSLVAGGCVHGHMAQDEDVDDRKKEKEKVNQKGNQKERRGARAIPNARKEAVQRWHMGSAPTATGVVTG